MDFGSKKPEADELGTLSGGTTNVSLTESSRKLIRSLSLPSKSVTPSCPPAEFAESSSVLIRLSGSSQQDFTKLSAIVVNWRGFVFSFVSEDAPLSGSGALLVIISPVLSTASVEGVEIEMEPLDSWRGIVGRRKVDSISVGPSGFGLLKVSNSVRIRSASASSRLVSLSEADSGAGRFTGGSTEALGITGNFQGSGKIVGNFSFNLFSAFCLSSILRLLTTASTFERSLLTY